MSCDICDISLSCEIHLLKIVPNLFSAQTLLGALTPALQASGVPGIGK